MTSEVVIFGLGVGGVVVTTALIWLLGVGGRP